VAEVAMPSANHAKFPLTSEHMLTSSRLRS